MHNANATAARARSLSAFHTADRHLTGRLAYTFSFWNALSQPSL